MENVFKPIPMAVFYGYKKIGTIYPEGWTYEGQVLKDARAVPIEPKYMRKLQKELRK